MSKWKEMREEENARVVEEIENEEDFPPLEDLEADLDRTLSDIDEAFRSRAAQERQRFAETCDTAYYFTVYFNNRQQMEEFCERFGLDYTQFYFDGRDVARQFNKALKSKDTAFKKVHPFNKDYVERAMKV